MFSKIPQGDAFREIISDQNASGLRKKNLPAMSRSAHPRRPVDIHSDIAGGRNQRLTRVQSHPYMQLYSFRPGVCGDCALCFESRQCGVFGARKGDKEGIALGIDFMAIVFLETPAQ
ncbi:MAG: hypothetical protein A2V59_12205 [Armatimonadetes bacterium RBG_19FT_COMBO_69_19]|nr:MAG: hypothetical protein A2V59_12205 [Armatimonadetes bacterium RBG_19FT_COMBO_69_19]